MNPRVSVPKIFLRGNKWYVRVQVPKSMQKRLKRKEHWVSLKTSSKAEALQRATAATQQKRREINAVYRRLEDIRETITELTEEQLIALGREEYARHSQAQSDLINDQKQSGLSWAEFVDTRAAAIKGAVAELRANHDTIPMTEIRAHQLMDENQVLFPKNSTAYQQLLKVCADAFIDAKRAELAVLEGYSIHENPNPMFINLATGQPHPFTALSDQLAMPPEPTPSLTALMEKFLNNPTKLRTDKTKKSIRGYLGVVFQILGDDAPVGDITEADCERVRDLIARLPPNFMKLPDADKHTLDELADIAERKKMPKLSPTGVNNYLRWLLTFLAYCHRKGMMDRMPTAYAEIKVADPVRKQDKREAFSNEQLNVIFRSRVYQDQERESSLFWVPLIALWNGMRSNEICQLDVADIKLEENVWGFDVTHISTTGDDDKSVKTSSSIRFVPMHPRLIDFGLLDFHAARPRDAKLFGDITRGVDGYYSTNFSKKVNRYLKGIGAHGPKHKFHSFRHNFRDALRRGRVDREIGKALGGWTGGNTDAFDIYGNGFEVGELSNEIGLVDYPQVDWSKI
ncbi:hypothetical protein ASD8599_01394 [Ascidiaceihabitans donghaensis]|uniref:DUF6538 domain-containing protein n=1 Tax=Ascidiaceihabitans donghaensis TaxID=1510460 RepID=A0A2R8BC84_9RHOB|nr:site-specific integrase [Ascidiaceihabitans donghaensis]SPH20655.1 hypothetical protein ASD8599_01394 [Ascidiaceihabitans donghaensis]